jgi:hypothetical protein
MPEKFKRLSARLKKLSEHKRINIELFVERSEGGVCLPLGVRPQDSLCNAQKDLDGLHNKHGYYRDKHRCRGKGYDEPTQAGTGMSLHEFLGGRLTMLYIRPSGKIVHSVGGVIPEAVALKYIENAASTHSDWVEVVG